MAEEKQQNGKKMTAKQKEIINEVREKEVQFNNEGDLASAAEEFESIRTIEDVARMAAKLGGAELRGELNYKKDTPHDYLKTIIKCEEITQRREMKDLELTDKRAYRAELIQARQIKQLKQGEVSNQEATERDTSLSHESREQIA